MSFPAESEQNDIFDRVGPLTTEKLIILKTNAKSRANFVVLLLKELFDPKELEGKNIAGVRGKEMVNPEMIDIIKYVVQRFYPVPVADVVPVGVRAARPWTNTCADQPRVVKDFNLS